MDDNWGWQGLPKTVRSYRCSVSDKSWKNKTKKAPSLKRLRNYWQILTTMTAWSLLDNSELMGKTFQAAQLTHERFLTIDHSCKIFFWYLPNWTSTNLWCVVLYATYSTTHQRSVEVQFGRYQKNILQEWCRVKKLSCVSCGSLKRFPHTFTTWPAIQILTGL